MVAHPRGGGKPPRGRPELPGSLEDRVPADLDGDQDFMGGMDSTPVADGYALVSGGAYSTDYGI